jgi:hypothetical protein
MSLLLDYFLLLHVISVYDLIFFAFIFKAGMHVLKFRLVQLLLYVCGLVFDWLCFFLYITCDPV